MDKEHILCEIRRTADDNGGKALGQMRFASATGIRESDWRGIHWARWGDALTEAGYSPNEWVTAYDEGAIFDKLIPLVRKFDRFPTQAELDLHRQQAPDFPSESVFRRLGKKSEVAARLVEYCEGRADCVDIAEICQSVARKSGNRELQENLSATKDDAGYVYLLRSGSFYKVGRTNSHGRREYELAIQLPEKAEKVHVIATDDPVGIEAYWHNRFADKRMNGEWFELSTADIKAFKRRKFM